MQYIKVSLIFLILWTQHAPLQGLSKTELYIMIAEISENTLVVVHFTTETCLLCNVVKQPFNALVQSEPSVKFITVDTNNSKDLVQQYHITPGVPEFVFIKNQQQIGNIKGTNFDSVRKFVNNHK